MAAVLMTVSVTAGGAVLASSAVAQAGSAPAAAATVAADEQGFALDLLGRLGPASPNLVLSPSSLATLLSMVEPGAVGTTAAGIAGPALECPRWRPGGGRMGGAHSGDAGPGHHDGIARQSGNEIWLETGFPVRAAYLALLASDFAAGVQHTDLSRDPLGAAQAINSWTAAHTGGHVTHIVQPAMLQSAVAVLVDAVYLKAPWATPFDPNATAQAPFHVSPTSTVSVQMMSTPGTFEVAVLGTPAVDAVELPYVGGHLSALVLMPPLGDLRAFEATLTPALLGRTVAGLDRLRAEIDLPRFSFGTALSMKRALSAMGMGQAFSDNADFSNLSPMPVKLSLRRPRGLGESHGEGDGGGGGVGHGHRPDGDSGTPREAGVRPPLLVPGPGQCHRRHPVRSPGNQPGHRVSGSGPRFEVDELADSPDVDAAEDGDDLRWAATRRGEAAGRRRSRKARSECNSGARRLCPSRTR